MSVRGVARAAGSTLARNEPLVVCAALILLCCAFFGAVGADARWLAALGRVIAARHAVPQGVPFAAAPSGHWHNVLVLPELLFHWLEAGLGGDRGLMLAQLVAVAVALLVLSRDALAAGAGPGPSAAALALAALGALPSLAIARVQLFSLVAFPLLVALLRSEARAPSRRIWLALPLLAVWSNLHGAVLLGLAVLLAYLLLDRVRADPRRALAVAALAPLALCLTPELLGTVAYYRGVLTNVAAQRGLGLWGPLDLGAPFDDVMLVVTLILGLSLRRVRPARWELATMLLLAAATVHAARSGVWLLFFLVAPAALAFRERSWRRVPAVPVLVAALAAVGISVARGPIAIGAGPGLIARAVTLAHGTPILAGDVIAEQVALAGGRVWVANPIDAFSHRDQGLWLDWSAGRPPGRAALGEGVRVVLVARGSGAERLMAGEAGFAAVAGDARARLYARVNG
jgi:hypothetical protein